MKHTPVLLQEIIWYLDIKSGGKYIDATVGAGGHARAILENGGEVLGIDRDETVISELEGDTKFSNSKFQAVHGSFADLKKIAGENKFDHVSGILFDLGMGSHQLDDAQRGFTFQKDGPLDMRYDQRVILKGARASDRISRDYIASFQNNKGEITAADILNNCPETDLIRIFKSFGEEKQFAKRIACSIISQRKKLEITRTSELYDLIKASLPARSRFRAGKVARRIFQSLRIAVNQELEIIEKALPQAVDLLEAGGRLVVISFHSLEDRIIKNFLNEEAAACICPPEVPICRCDKKSRITILTPKPIIASEEEARINPRSKSAKLRAAERL